MENNGDWKNTGKDGMFRIIGASNHSEHERTERDFYATDPAAMEALLKYETFAPNVWEPCCGKGHLSNVLKQHGYNVKESDIVDRIGNEVIDFLFMPPKFDGDIITNPPYAMAKECVEQAIRCIPEGNKVAMFLKLTFLEGKARRELFRVTPPNECMSSQNGRNVLLTEIFQASSQVLSVTHGSYGRKATKDTLSFFGFKKHDKI